MAAACPRPVVCGVQKVIFSIEQLLAVIAIVVITAAVVAAARLRPGPWTRTASITLAGILVTAEVACLIYDARTSAIGAEIAAALPLQLCDVVIFVAAAALLLRKQL